MLAFGTVLLVCASLSGLAARTVLSTAVLFLLAGALVGQGGFGWVDLPSNDAFVTVVADVALFTVLFTDGHRAGIPALRETWRLYGRALGLGMPLTMAGIAVLVHFLTGLDWATSFLIGAVLSPTDPVFAAAVVGRDEVPLRLRRLLNLESGVNDGLALPFVLVFLALSQHREVHLGTIAIELLTGVALGVVIPGAAALLWRSKFLGPERGLESLGPIALGVLLYGLCELTHANLYLAAFAAGTTLATICPEVADEFERIGEVLSELTKFFALLVFGAFLTLDRISGLDAGEWVVAVLAIVLVRPAALLLSMLGSRLDRRERLTAAWFGPKGFASVIYALLVLHSGITTGPQVFDLVAVTIMLSILLHSSTDVPIAKALRTD